jgi:hypothetical protein
MRFLSGLFGGMAAFFTVTGGGQLFQSHYRAGGFCLLFAVIILWCLVALWSRPG